MKAFVGVIMSMAINYVNCCAWEYNTPSDLTWAVQSKQIFWFLHICDKVPHCQPGYDPLFKVRRCLDIIAPVLESEYNPHEQMVKFKGRLGLKQYMKDKPTKWGIKVFVLADAITSFVFRFQVYTDKNSDLDRGDVGFCTRVVLELKHGVEHKSHKLFVDNYYTSPCLFLELHRNHVKCMWDR